MGSEQNDGRGGGSEETMAPTKQQKMFEWRVNKGRNLGADANGAVGWGKEDFL